MNAAVVYFSRTGNTKKVAEAIAGAIGCDAASAAEFDAQKPVDLLFVGGAVYGGKLDPALAEFIGRLDPAKVKRAAVFSTYFIGETASAMMNGALKERGIPVEEGSYCCKGKFLLMQRKFPGEAELDEAGRFAAYVPGRAGADSSCRLRATSPSKRGMRSWLANSLPPS